MNFTSAFCGAFCCCIMENGAIIIYIFITIFVTFTFDVRFSFGFISIFGIRKPPIVFRIIGRIIIVIMKICTVLFCVEVIVVFVSVFFEEQNIHSFIIFFFP